MGKKKTELVGKDADDVAEMQLGVKAKVTKNALYFRQQLAGGTATLPDGREVEIDACTNINGDSVLIGLKPKGGKDWFTYVFMMNDVIQVALQDFAQRFPKK